MRAAEGCSSRRFVGAAANAVPTKLAQVCQERVDCVCTLFWLLAHPPMTCPFQDGHLCPGAFSGTARELLPAAVEIFRRDQRQAGFGGCPWQARSKVAHHRLNGRSVQRKYCPAQVPVRTRSYV